ncbi:MAG: bifunctional DNA-binding transcriptional regulator/O6-methylguanine-DNA methyltransferase Ada [Candidatus Aminicenantes bacterium]|nr:bifunctional DNA-binding transcriptional regulator/O6-methylguanine-DNA methyltransferase Ada [Candidatus Aminicenantes bacterium]
MMVVERIKMSRQDERGPASGKLFYGVATTGIYCRRGCPSRRPNPRNIRYFGTSADAERAGYRSCKRCRPESPEAPDPRLRIAVEACRSIEKSETPPSLRELAAAAGLSPFHFQRLFKSVVGVTPKQYAMEKRSNRLRRQLRDGRAISTALYDAGFASSSRFYENAAATLGMRPSEYRSGAPGEPIRFTIVRSYLGPVLVAATMRGICAIEFGRSEDALKDRLRTRFPKAELRGPDPGLRKAVARVLSLLEEPRKRRPALPLDVEGTSFQRRVWQALSRIPAGSTVTYAEIAARVGRPKAARAVAQACAANPVAVAIPCHRVVRADGGPGGYRWGVVRKKKLLEREAR